MMAAFFVLRNASMSRGGPGTLQAREAFEFLRCSAAPISSVPEADFFKRPPLKSDNTPRRLENRLLPPCLPEVDFKPIAVLPDIFRSSAGFYFGACP